MSNTLYLVPYTLYSNVAVLLLWETGVQDQYTWTPLNLDAGENNTPEFIRLNPEGKVPVLVHQGRSIPDTLAIARFLDPTDTLKSNDPSVLDIVEQFRKISLRAVKFGESPENQDDEVTRETLTKIIARLEQLQAEHGIYEERIKAFQARVDLFSNQDAYVALKHHWDALLDRLEAALENHAYLAGDSFTLADVYAVSFLFSSLPVLSQSPFTNRPRLEQYYKDQWTRPAVVGALTRPST